MVAFIQRIFFGRFSWNRRFPWNRRVQLQQLLVLFMAGMLAFNWNAAAAASYILPDRTDPPAGSVLGYSPKLVVAYFPEELRVDSSTLEVFNSQGQQVDDRRGGVDTFNSNHMVMLARVRQTLPLGIYTVQWTVGLTDGSIAQGNYTFTVANPPPPGTYSYPGVLPPYAGLYPGELTRPSNSHPEMGQPPSDFH